MAHAALVGRLAATAGGTDYQAYYDTNANLTWLADANYAKTSGYSADGTFLFSNDAGRYAAGVNIAGVTGWQYPGASIGANLCKNGYSNGYVSLGYRCTGSAMSNLFYNVLGGVEGKSIATTHNANYHLFSNIQENHPYWSDVIGVVSYDFDFSKGYQGMAVWGTHFLWLQHYGDVKPPAPPVSAVPVPATIWLFGSGLVGFIGLAKRKTRALAA